MAFDKDIKSVFQNLIKKKKSVRIENINVNQVDTDILKEEKKEKKKTLEWDQKIARKQVDILGGLKVGFTTSITELGRNVQASYETTKGLIEKFTKSQLAEKSSQTAYDIITGMGPFGQTFGLLNETLKDLGLDIPKIVGSSFTMAKDGVKKIFEKKEIVREEEESTRDENIENELAIQNDQQNVLLKISDDISSLLQLKKRELGIIEETPLGDVLDEQQKSTELMRNQHDEIMRDDERDDKREKISERKQDQKEKKDEIKKEKAAEKRHNTFFTRLFKTSQIGQPVKKGVSLKGFASIGAGLLGGGMILGDIGKGGDGGLLGSLQRGIFGKAPDFFERGPEGELDFTRKKEGSDKQAIGHILKQTTKFGALGYLLGGGTGALIGSLIGAITSGLQIFYLKWIQPLFGRMQQWYDQNVAPIFTKIGDTIEALGGIADIVPFKKKKTRQTQIETVTGKRLGLELQEREDVVQKRQVMIDGKKISATKFLQTEMESIFGTKKSRYDILQNALKTTTTADEQLLVEKYSNLIQQFEKYKLITDSEQANFQKRLDDILETSTKQTLKTLQENGKITKSLADEMKNLNLENRSKIAKSRAIISSNLEDMKTLSLELLYGD